MYMVICEAASRLTLATSRSLVQTMAQGKYVEVLGGEQDLMEAIYTKGPMTVSVDAGSPGFRFYKSGVFDYDKCAAAVAASPCLWHAA